MKKMKNILLHIAMLLVFCINHMQSQTKGGKNYPGPNTTFPIPQLIEEVKRKGNETAIPFRRFLLSNGLNVILHEDHSNPVVYVDVTYHVGSAREQQGRSGFAHFFEHMMFQGSKHVADDQHFKIVTEAGGRMNGSTNTDRTNYFETVPSNHLEKMLWLEADRMGFLLDSVTQRKFEIQRATVKNERGQRYDNAPYGLVNERIGEALYPEGHGYSWSTIGYIEDLNRVDVNDLKRFYMRWYGPNNAVLTIAGDFNEDKVLLLVQKYFGNLKECPKVSPQKSIPVILDANRYVSYEDNVKFPLLTIAIPTVKKYTREDAALEALGFILSGNQSSPLQKTFIESKKASNASASQFSRELAGHFVFSVRANPGTKLSETEKELRRALSEWEKKGATDDDLLRFKAGYVSGLYNNLSTVQGKGAALASYFTLAGNAGYMSKELALMNSLTKADVMNVYRKYIKSKPAVIVSCVPRGKSDLKAGNDNWTMYQRMVEKESAEYKNLTYVAPTDDFNRALMPAMDLPGKIESPQVFRLSIGNIPVAGITDPEIPKVNMVLSFRAGHWFEPLKKAGLASLTAQMLNKSTQKRKAADFEKELERLGSSIRYSADNEKINVNVSCLRKNLKATIQLLKESLLYPAMDTAELSLLKKRQIDRIQMSRINASSTADKVFNGILYGQENIQGTPIEGHESSLSSITIDDIKEHYRKLNAANLMVAVSGDIKSEEVPDLLSFLGTLPKGESSEVYSTYKMLPSNDKTTIYFVDKKGAAQSEIRIGYLALPYDTEGEYFRCRIMNFPLGGAFNSRISFTMRELKGWTYSCRSSFNGSKMIGPFVVNGGYKANVTDSAVREIMHIITQYAENGPDEKEVEFARNSLLQQEALSNESAGQKLSYVLNLLEYQQTSDYRLKQEEILKRITKEELKQLAQRFLPSNKMIIVIVGDKAENFEKVKTLGYEVIELDQNGREMKN